MAGLYYGLPSDQVSALALMDNTTLIRFLSYITLQAVVRPVDCKPLIMAAQQQLARRLRCEEDWLKECGDPLPMDSQENK